LLTSKLTTLEYDLTPMVSPVVLPTQPEIKMAGPILDEQIGESSAVKTKINEPYDFPYNGARHTGPDICYFSHTSPFGK
jgi:hypothetical protein